MHNTILIPVAIDPEAVVARKLALARALLNPGGTITLLTVLEQPSGFVAEFVTVKSENHLTQKILDRLNLIAGNATDIECRVIIGKPGLEVTRFAANTDTDLVIVGSHKPGVQDYFLGSTAARIVRRAPCSVHVVR